MKNIIFAEDKIRQEGMDKKEKEEFLRALKEHELSGIRSQLDYDKFAEYSIISNSTAIEGSSITEEEVALLLEEGITVGGKSFYEHLMNHDLKEAYTLSRRLAERHVDFSLDMLRSLAAAVMKNTGTLYNTVLGSFDSSCGDFRLLNVTAGAGGRSYMSYDKIVPALERFCTGLNLERNRWLVGEHDIVEGYRVSFRAHYNLVTIHPWADGNGRTSRLVMNHLQREFGLMPVKVSRLRKAEYISSLVKTRERGDITVFEDFMFREHLRNIREELCCE